MRNQLFLDTECYPNYFLIVFKSLNGEEECFVIDEKNRLSTSRVSYLLSNFQTIGFNSRFYDLPMITYALTGVDNVCLKVMSNRLIPDKNLLKEGLVNSSYDVIKENNLWCPYEYDHIDIMNVAKGRSSLKLYGARIGSKKLQDLPYDHLSIINSEQKEDVKNYCINDINITIDLFKYLHKELAVREDLNKEYQVDSRSKSDAQIAELVIKKFCKFDKKKLQNEVKFKFNSHLDFKFKNNELIKLKSDLDTIEFNIKRHAKIHCKGIHRTININNIEYNFGIGGLHSKEQKRSIISDKDEWLIDIDVSSCYPKIILNGKLSPPQIEQDFLNVFNEFYEERQLSKQLKNITKSEVLKIILNGIFGKFADSHSDFLYSPELLINTTITGQLGLLLLIERLEEYSFNVVSANTDGITVKVKKDNYDKFRKIINLWEKKFNYKTEEVKYTALYNHSVNSYIAVKEDGSLKLKGIFAENDISRNIDVPICKKAVINYVTKGIKIEDTILNNKLDPVDLIKIRKTKYGGYWKGKYLGHTVRWYWSTEGDSITNSKGHKIAETNDAYPFMDLEENVRNIHYDKYIKKSYELLKLIGL